MKAYWDALKQFLKSKTFIVAVLVTALLSYGFAATNVTVGIDDLEAERYIGIGGQVFTSGRFGMTVLSKLFGYGFALVENGFVIDLISVAMFILSAINLCILFQKISQNRISITACTIFTCIWISYPLMNELWEYTATNVVVCSGFLFASIALLLVYEFIHNPKTRRPLHIAAAVVLMMLVCSGYEAVVPVYIFFVFAILSLQVVYGTEKEKRLKGIILHGIVYATVLAGGLLLRFIVHRILLIFINDSSAAASATDIYWGTAPALDVFKDWVFGTIKTVLRSIIYFPLTELLFAIILLLIIGVAAARKHGAVLLLPGFGMFLSLILLSLVQGSVSPYRTCQVYGAFVAFVVMLVIIIVQQTDWKRMKWIRPAAIILAAYLCFHQAVYLNYFLTLNHIRSEEEAFVVRQISVDLQEDYDTSKPVIFVGIYKLSDYIQKKACISNTDPRWRLYSALWRKCHQFRANRFDLAELSRKLPQTNVTSVLCWGWYAYEQASMEELFSYYGFEYDRPADYYAVFSEANQYAYDTKMPKYPQDGYIQDMGDYIIVCLGEV